MSKMKVRQGAVHGWNWWFRCTAGFIVVVAAVPYLSSFSSSFVEAAVGRRSSSSSSSSTLFPRSSNLKLFSPSQRCRYKGDSKEIQQQHQKKQQRQRHPSLEVLLLRGGASSSSGGNSGWGYYDDDYSSSRQRQSQNDYYSNYRDKEEQRARNYNSGDYDDRYSSDRYYDDGRRSPKKTDAGITNALPSVLKTGDRKIGFILLGAGGVVTMLGVSLFFNKTLMRLGNLLFIAGVPITIGPSRTARYFFRPEKTRATACLAVGIFMVFIGHPTIGIVLEIFGLMNLFGNMFPLLTVFLKQMPFVKTLLENKSNNNNNNNNNTRRAASSSPSYGRDTYNDDEDNDDNYRYYNDQDYYQGNQNQDRYY